MQQRYHLASHADVTAVTDDRGQLVHQAWKRLIAMPQTRHLDWEMQRQGERQTAGPSTTFPLILP